MVLLLPLLLAAAPPPLTPIQSAERIEPIGWSADRHIVALRVFFGGTYGEAEPCAGYIDAAGKQFGNGLAIVVLKDGAVLHSFEIQASPMNSHCTPLADAKKALDAAKKKLEELGIDRAAVGTVLPIAIETGKTTTKKKGELLVSTWKETWRAGGAEAPLEIVATLSDSVEVETYHSAAGSFAWKLRTADGERSGALKLGPVEWSLNMAGGFAWKLMAIASPGGESVVALISEDHFNMRGSSSKTTLLPLNAKK